MGRRVKSFKIHKKYLFIGLGVTLISLALVAAISLTLTGCRRNPLMDYIESPGITVKVDGKTIQPGSDYDMGRVKPGNEYSATFTIQNSGNLDLKLTGSPLVNITADPETAAMFSISPAPSSLVKVQASSDFTLVYNPLGVDVERTIQLLVTNTFKKDNFTFDLVSLVN
jgi:hypothetical protein